MLRRAKIVSVLFVLSGATTGGAQANTTDLAVLNDQSARVTAASSWKCASNISVTIDAADASFFEARLNDLGMLYGAALSQLTAGCPSLNHVSIYGKTNDVEVVKGQSKKSDGWTLRLDQPNLTKDALRIPDRIKTFDDLNEMLDVFAPYRTVPGIDRTSGYLLFAQNSRAAVRSLLSKPALFEQFIEKSTLEMDEDARRQQIGQVLNIVKLYEPQVAQDLSQRAPQMQSATLRTAALRVLDEATESNGEIKAAVIETHTHLSALTPDAGTLAEVDAALATWIETRVLDHETEHSGAYLDSTRAHMDFAQTLSATGIETLLPETQTAVDTASFWFEALSEELLSDNVAEATSLIEASGSSYEEIDLILETGLAMYDEFLEYGFEDEAASFVALAEARIGEAIENGLDLYRSRIAAENMTLDRVAFYKQEADLFYALSEDYPGFAGYVEAIEAGVRIGQLQACAVVASTVEKSANRQSMIVVDGQSFPLKSLACALYTNGHLLTDVSVARGGDDGSMTLLENNENEMTVEITSTGEENAFWGVSDSWDDEMGALVIPPPSGQPDRNGVTECDMLAGDPHDTTLPTQGVVLEEVGVDYDFDRAVEACIAAVEHDPNATRQVYQLARILEFLGDTESAAHYAEVAAEREYAPAIHLQAFSILTYRDDDDAFFDAVDLLKVSSGLGYAPSKAELNELMPPGVELFRERPPPSDEQILDAVGRKKCESNIFAQACSIRTGVAKKSCFQTAENAFSCELVLRHRCTMSTGMDSDPVMRMFTGLVTNSCSPTTDPMFMKLTKSGDKWSARSEF